ncbi:hypothetical protein GCM10009670_15700 [Citricoccus alkalitolerans]
MHSVSADLICYAERSKPVHSDDLDGVLESGLTTARIDGGKDVYSDLSPYG